MITKIMNAAILIIFAWSPVRAQVSSTEKVLYLESPIVGNSSEGEINTQLSKIAIDIILKHKTYEIVFGIPSDVKKVEKDVHQLSLIATYDPKNFYYQFNFTILDAKNGKIYKQLMKSNIERRLFFYKARMSLYELFWGPEYVKEKLPEIRKESVHDRANLNGDQKKNLEQQFDLNQQPTSTQRPTGPQSARAANKPDSKEKRRPGIYDDLDELQQEIQEKLREDGSDTKNDEANKDGIPDSGVQEEKSGGGNLGPLALSGPRGKRFYYGIKYQNVYNRSKYIIGVKNNYNFVGPYVLLRSNVNDYNADDFLFSFNYLKGLIKQGDYKVPWLIDLQAAYVKVPKLLGIELYLGIHYHDLQFINIYSDVSGLMLYRSQLGWFWWGVGLSFDLWGAYIDNHLFVSKLMYAKTDFLAGAMQLDGSAAGFVSNIPLGTSYALVLRSFGMILNSPTSSKFEYTEAQVSLSFTWFRKSEDAKQ